MEGGSEFVFSLVLGRADVRLAELGRKEKL